MFKEKRSIHMKFFYKNALYMQKTEGICPLLFV